MIRFALFLVSTTLGFALHSHADIVINEIHYDPLPDVGLEEFVEIHNPEAGPVDVSGWQLSSAVDLTIPAGTNIEGGGYLVLALDPGQPLFTDVPSVTGPWIGKLSSRQEGERVVLRNADGEIVDEVSYNVRFPWPLASAGDGGSMELINPALDNDLGTSWRAATDDTPSPGARNSAYSETPPPNIRRVNHSPKQPTDHDPIVITAKITDPELYGDARGIASVTLHYKAVPPGGYTPAYLPLKKANLLANPNQERRQNGAYRGSLFTGGPWPTVSMTDDGEGDDVMANDGIYTASLPAQVHRTLLRYRIEVENQAGEEVEAPLPDDPSLNFACFCYNGVPDYVAEDSSQGANHTYGQDVLGSLPVYHFLTRNEDWLECLAYDGGDQHPREAMEARRYYNWNGTFVYEGEVYDNISYRLRGGNGRYHERGKRSMKFRFNRGRYLEPRDNRGEKFPQRWRVLTTSKMFGNRLSGTFGTRNRPGNFGLIDTVNGRLWELFKVPASRTFWFHFRVIDDAKESPDQYGGDFYGLNLGLERFDVRFLEARGMAKGNLYKLTDRISSGADQQRYQTATAVTDQSDYLNIKNNLRSNKDDDWLRQYVNWDNWYRYTAVEEAIRHYDYWPTADKNMVYYFEPQAGNPLGYFWQLPYDSDASWGPSWNEGIDIPQQAVANKGVFQQELVNTIREFRDLVWTEEVIFPLIDDAAKVIEAFHPADDDRWRAAPSATGRQNLGTLESKVEDMKLFAFQGNLNYPGGSVGAGGRAAHLDDLISRGVPPPKTPEITFTGTDGHPVDGIGLQSSAYANSSIFVQSDPTVYQWRLGEITDPTAPAYDPNAARVYEITEVWTAETLPDDTEALRISIPPDVLKVGRTYRARVRHYASTGAASSWSEPYQFTTNDPAGFSSLKQNLLITEIMYHPAAPSDEEKASGFSESDFEYVELHNRGSEVLNLENVRFTKGVDFDFSGMRNPMLAPGAYLLVVANEAAFATRYGDGLPLAGEWDAGRRLSNAGERLKISFGAGNAIHDFVYDDEAPDWPTGPDGMGQALALGDPGIDPENLGLAASWQSAVASPGAASGPVEETALAVWMTANGLGTDPFADPHGEGRASILTFTFALDLGGTRNLPKVQRGADGNVELTMVVRAEAGIAGSGVKFAVEESSDGRAWQAGEVEPLDDTDNGDGTRTVRWRADTPPLDEKYYRARVTE